MPTPEQPAATGDVDFEREALPWLDDVYRFALSLTRDPSDADDVVQETFLRAYRSWHTYTPGSDCRRWLFTICRNAFLRTLERERPTVDLEDAERDVIGAAEVYAGALEEGYTDLFARVDVLQHVWDYLDEQLTDETTERLREHLSDCHQCFGYKTFQENFLSALASLRERPGAPPELRARVMATLREDGFAR